MGDVRSAQRALLGGTLSAGDVGNYANVGISVSRRRARVASARVRHHRDAGCEWLGVDFVGASGTNTDGTPTETLTGYKVFYGLASRQYTSSLPVMNPDLTSVTIEQLEPATWYFAVKAVNSAGVESAYSSEVSKNVQ